LLVKKSVLFLRSLSNFPSKNLTRCCGSLRLKLCARRRVGELSAGLEKSAGGYAPLFDASNSGVTSIKPKVEALADAGLTKMTANRCEKIAGIEEGEFEADWGDSG
jgi:hypothetical protein